MESGAHDKYKQQIKKTGGHNKVTRRMLQKKENTQMKMQEIRNIAMILGIDTKLYQSKQGLIREIQVKEGNPPCLKTKETCENDCLWKADCLGKKQ